MKKAWIGLMVAAVVGVAGAARAVGQAESTSWQRMRLQTFGMLSYVNPDYGGAKKNAGGTVGAELNFGQFFHRVEPSLELRAVGSGGRVSNQYVYSAGPRVELDYGKFHPYGVFTVGYGKITFATPAVFATGPYVFDTSTVFTYGGGLDYTLNRTWAVRADVTRQSWQVGQTAAPFYPTTVSVGVRYRFHFHDKSSPF